MRSRVWRSLEGVIKRHPFPFEQQQQQQQQLIPAFLLLALISQAPSHSMPGRRRHVVAWAYRHCLLPPGKARSVSASESRPRPLDSRGTSTPAMQQTATQHGPRDGTLRGATSGGNPQLFWRACQRPLEHASGALGRLSMDVGRPMPVTRTCTARTQDSRSSAVACRSRTRRRFR